MRVQMMVVLCLLLSAVVARAGIEKFVDDKTAFAAEVDLTKADPEAIEKWITATCKAADLLPAGGPGPNQAELGQAMDRMKRWLADAKAQGATVVYVVANDEQTNYLPFVVIVPVADDKAKAMASLLYSGTVTGPSRPDARRQDPGPRMGRQPIAEEVPGVGAMFGVGERITFVRAIQPKPRPDLEAAFKSAGDVVAKAAIAPTAKLQGNMRGAPMPILTLVGNTKWLVASVTAPPKVIAKLTLQAKDAEAAKQVQQMMVMYTAMGVASGVGFTPEFSKLLTPTLRGDQVVLALDDKQLVALATELKGPMALARQQAMRVASMSNMRQLLMGCLMYQTENNSTWPDNLQAIEKYLGAGAKQVMTNPAHPEITPAYVYFKPTGPIPDSAKHVVIHEAHTDFGNGVNVGFADGHVEFVSSKARFDELIAATAQAAQP